MMASDSASPAAFPPFLALVDLLEGLEEHSMLKAQTAILLENTYRFFQTKQHISSEQKFPGKVV